MSELVESFGQHIGAYFGGAYGADVGPVVSERIKGWIDGPERNEICVERTKPAISGLYAVQGDGRYVHTVEQT